jgi:parvulin-like peptidyl-prolyl isomerase
MPKEEIEKAVGQDNLKDHDPEWFRDRVIFVKMRQQKMAQVPEPTPEDIEEYYKTHQKEFWEEDRVHLWRIDFPKGGAFETEAVREQATEVRKQLVAQKEFPSEEELNNQSGGAKIKVRDEWYEVPVLRHELAEVASSLKPGEVSDLIEVSNCIFIMQLLEKTAAHQLPLHQVYDSASRSITKQRQAAAEQKWYQDLRKQAVIQIFPTPEDL